VTVVAAVDARHAAALADCRWPAWAWLRAVLHVETDPWLV